MDNIINKDVHRRFVIHPKYTNLVWEVEPLEPSDTMKTTDWILGTVAKFKQNEDWFIFIYNLTQGSADILRLGDGQTKYGRLRKSQVTPEELLYKLIHKETDENITLA